MCFDFMPLQYSLCNDPLIELSNPGASGSIFYVSSDDEFIIKTVQHKEAEFLQKLLPGYFMVCNLIRMHAQNIYILFILKFISFCFCLKKSVEGACGRWKRAETLRCA